MILAVGADEVAVRQDQAVAIYGLDGALHHTLRVEHPETGVFLPDGRLVIFGTDLTGKAWVVRDGRVERTIAAGRVWRPEVLPNGLVFDGKGRDVTWIDPDTGEVATLEIEGGRAMHPSGSRITRLGFLGAEGYAFPSQIPADPDGCRFIPGDARAWCEVGCEIRGFTMSGVESGRIDGCDILAAGERSVVVRREDGYVWVDLDGHERARISRGAKRIQVGPTAVGWTDEGDFVDAGAGAVPLPPPAVPPLPPGIVVEAGPDVLRVALDGSTAEPLAGAPTARPKAPRLPRFRSEKGDLSMIDEEGKELLRIPGAAGSVCASAPGLILVRAGDSISAWDTAARARRWTTPDAGTKSCQVRGEIVLMANGDASRVLDLSTGKLLAHASDARTSQDGQLVAAFSTRSTEILDRDGRRYGTLPGRAVPLGLVGDVAVVISERPVTHATVLGLANGGAIRWERVSTANPVMVGDTVYLGGSETLMAVNGRDGTTRWTWPLPARPTGVRVLPD